MYSILESFLIIHILLIYLICRVEQRQGVHEGQYRHVSPTHTNTISPLYIIIGVNVNRKQS
jgi:hypothetical protein